MIAIIIYFSAFALIVRYFFERFTINTDSDDSGEPKKITKRRAKAGDKEVSEDE